MDELISVIITTRNGMPHLEKAVDSVLAQTYPHYELIIVDDASSDNSQPYLAALRLRPSKPIQIIQLDEAGGQANAINLGLAASRGQIVSLLHSDDEWMPGKLEAVAAAFRDMPNISAHHHHMYVMQQNQVRQRTYCSMLKIGDIYNMASPVELPQEVDAPGSALSFSRTALELMGPIPQDLSRCAEAYVLRAVLRYGRLSATDDILGIYSEPDYGAPWLNEFKITDPYVQNLTTNHVHDFCRARTFQSNVQPIVLNTKHEHSDAISTLRLTKGEHVLIIRSVASTILVPFIERLAEQGVNVHLLAPPSVSSFGDSKNVHVYEIPEGTVEPDSIPAAFACKLRGLKLAYAIVLYAMPMHRYDNIHDAINSLQLDCPTIGITNTGAVHPVRLVQKPFDTLGNTEAIARLKNTHSGQRAFIIGNGPSLCVDDLNRLEHEITFAANKIYLVYNQTSWRPSYYMVEDTLVAQQNHAAIEAITDSTKLFPYRLTEWLHAPFSNSVYFPFFWPDLTRSPTKFSFNAMHMLYWGSTIVYTMLQMACYMGIRELYLIGVDFSFIEPRMKDTNDDKMLISEGERNHFHPDYRKPGEKWYVPNLDVQAASFTVARQTIESSGGSVFNATRGGKLEVFERVDFDKLF